MKNCHAGPYNGLLPYCDQFPQDGVATDKRTTSDHGGPIDHCRSRNVAMVFNHSIVLYQGLGVDDAIAADSGSGGKNVSIQYAAIAIILTFGALLIVYRIRRGKA